MCYDRRTLANLEGASGLVIKIDEIRIIIACHETWLTDLCLFITLQQNRRKSCEVKQICYFREQVFTNLANMGFHVGSPMDLTDDAYGLKRCFAPPLCTLTIHFRPSVVRNRAEAGAALETREIASFQQSRATALRESWLRLNFTHFPEHVHKYSKFNEVFSQKVGSSQRGYITNPSGLGKLLS